MKGELLYEQNETLYRAKCQSTQHQDVTPADHLNAKTR